MYVGMTMLKKSWLLTQCEFLPRVRREGESQQGHGGDENAGHDEVEEVVQGAAADVDGERDVHVGLRAALVVQLMSLPGDTFGMVYSKMLVKITWIGVSYKGGPFALCESNRTVATRSIVLCWSFLLVSCCHYICNSSPTKPLV